MLGQHKRNIT